MLQRHTVEMNARGIGALLRPLVRSFTSHKMSIPGSSMIGISSSMLFPTLRPIPSLSRSPLPAYRGSPVLQRVWVSSYLQAVRMQRMAQREGAAASKDNKDNFVASSKLGGDFFSKVAAGSGADVQAKASLDSEAALGAREDRPLFVTTVDAGKRRRMPWWAVWLGKGLSYWVLLVVLLYLYDQLQQSMMGSANKMIGGRKRVRIICACNRAPLLSRKSHVTAVCASCTRKRP
jgi:hypothetical protein